MSVLVLVGTMVSLVRAREGRWKGERRFLDFLGFVRQANEKPGNHKMRGV